MKRTEAEIAREARRILRRLAAPRAALFARANPSGISDYAVARNAAAAAGSRLATEADFVTEFLRAGWIVPDGAERLILSGEGRAFVVRSFGGEERFAAQHREMVAAKDGGRAVKVNLAESPLARLKSRGLIDATQFAAGEKLRRDYTLANLAPRMGVDLSAPVVSGGARGAGSEHLSDIAVAARQRFSRAMAAAGPGLSDLLFDICCDLAPLEGAEAKRGWSKRSARVVLMLALDRLAAHYGMTMVRAHAPIRAWAAE
ncbi:MAG: ATPase [Alphaproteobacteria bacterium]|nr:ATPase [Alphaproteobacteria bacterium]